MTNQPTFFLDTHCLYWYLVNSPRLSSSAASVFKDAYAGKAILVVHYIVLAELYYLLQKYNQIELFSPLLHDLQTKPYFRIEPIDFLDISSLEKYPAITEMHDRLIVIATDRCNATLVTRDQNIKTSSYVQCLW